MATVDFGEKRPTFMGSLFSGIGEGADRYIKLRQYREKQEEDTKRERIKRLLEAGEGPLTTEDASFMQKEGLGSRVGAQTDPLSKAIKGYMVLPTTQQAKEKALMERYYQQMNKQMDLENREEQVRKWVSSQQGLDPFKQAEAYTRAGIPVPAFVQDLINAQQQQEAMRTQRELQRQAAAEAQQRALYNRMLFERFRNDPTAQIPQP